MSSTSSNSQITDKKYSYGDVSVSTPLQDGKSNEDNRLPSLAEEGTPTRGSDVGDTVSLLPGPAEETSLGLWTPKSNKDPRLSVSEAFGIGEHNLHKKDDESLERAIADLD